MFNTPILDVAIGLVFVFLLYSLLATSINEALATGLSLRARMLRKAIALKMLSNTVQENKVLDFLKGIGEFFKECVYIFTGGPEKKGSQKNIGDQFYTHPIIKNYGSSSFFKIPSYLAASNFAIILIETLKEDFNFKIDEIAAFKATPDKPIAAWIDELNFSPDIIKIKELLDYYNWYYAANPGKETYTDLPGLPRGIDKEVHCILQLHLRNSLFNFNEFSKKIEGWYNDTMDRVSGWYKRQTQFILFVLGLLLAIIFNVDTIAISNKLSTDKDARDQIVQLAVQSADVYKNDPRVQRQTQQASPASQDSLLDLAQKKLDAAQKILDSSIDNPNQLLGLGWDKYGEDDTAFIKELSKKCYHKFIIFGKINLKDSLDTVSNQITRELDSIQKIKIAAARAQTPDTTKPGADRPQVSMPSDKFQVTTVNKDSIALVRFYKAQVKHYPVRIKTAYILQAIDGKKILGFIVTAFAICLGAPFWFDMLNKLIKIRGAGKKDDSSNKTELTATKETSTTIINTGASNTSEEAVG